MENVAVFPVPDWAWAITSLPDVIWAIALCWIADGFSKPKIQFFFYFFLNFLSFQFIIEVFWKIRKKRKDKP